jgi:glycosyltransferase 2 family protein
MHAHPQSVDRSRALTNTIKKNTKWFVTASLGALLYFFVDPAQFANAITETSPKAYVAAFGLASVVLFLNGLRWGALARSSGFPHKISTLVRVRLIAQGLNAILPGGIIGDGLQVFLITRKPGLSGARAFTSIVMDRLVALFVILTVLATTLNNTYPDLTTGVIAAVIASCSFVLVIGVMALLKFESYIHKNIRFLERGFRFLVRMAKEFSKAAKKPFVIVGVSILAFGGHLMTVGVVWLLVNQYTEVPFAIMLPVTSILVFLTLVPFTISGLGVREAALFAGLESYGISLEESVAISVIWLSITLLSVCLYAGLAVVSGPNPENIGEIYRQIRKIRNPAKYQENT